MQMSMALIWKQVINDRLLGADPERSLRNRTKIEKENNLLEADLNFPPKEGAAMQAIQQQLTTFD